MLKFPLQLSTRQVVVRYLPSKALLFMLIMLNIKNPNLNVWC